MSNKDKPFLKRLSASDRAEIEAGLVRRAFARDEVVLSQSVVSNEVYFVLEGMVRATSYSAEGRVVSFRDVPPGAVFGEVSGIDHGPRSADIVAIADTVVGVLGQSEFRALVDGHAGFRWALLDHMAAQSRVMTARIFEFSTMLVRDRLIHELLRLAEAAGSTTGRVELSPAPTHFDLATRISTHREAVSREMSKLSRRKLISKHLGALTLHDLDALRAQRDGGEVNG